MKAVTKVLEASSLTGPGGCGPAMMSGVVPTMNDTSGHVGPETSSSSDEDIAAGMFLDCNGRCGFAVKGIGHCDCADY